MMRLRRKIQARVRTSFNSMLTATDAEKEKMSLTIGALNQEFLQALSLLFEAE